MRKYIAYQNKADKQLQIKSVVVKEGIKGYIYVEAFKQPHLKAAIEDVGSLRMGVYKQEVSVHVFCF
jgi:transcription elongation factor SPT5